MTNSLHAPVHGLTTDAASLKSVRATGVWEGSMITRIESRGFIFRTDEPVPIGGTDASPTPMQYVVGAVNGCVTVVIETVANEQGFAVESVETFSHAHQDVRGFQGTADVSPHFKDFTLTVNLQAAIPEDRLEAFTSQVEKRCPAINLLRDAGVAFTVEWNIGARGTAK
ncbi:Uncharacterized OsmC-related protein [Arthrobacter subterraneus]|uniref:Uncharacterized OsmC-related protein n=2 Tax=Arthrobacter subterraneus TaxID=335973 RepID=A0A1G8LZ73_9MICC|nr:Uncharacterized OsmC-related protein [Arthrobacter subterraneus]